MQMVFRELDSIAQKNTVTCPSETVAWEIKGNIRLSIRNPIFTTGEKNINNSRSNNYVTKGIRHHLPM
jgi:hypothetical protein